jgi:hypothetical protein
MRSDLTMQDHHIHFRRDITRIVHWVAALSACRPGDQATVALFADGVYNGRVSGMLTFVPTCFDLAYHWMTANSVYGRSLPLDLYDLDHESNVSNAWTSVIRQPHSGS